MMQLVQRTSGKTTSHQIIVEADAERQETSNLKILVVFFCLNSSSHGLGGEVLALILRRRLLSWQHSAFPPRKDKANTFTRTLACKESHQTPVIPFFIAASTRVSLPVAYGQVVGGLSYSYSVRRVPSRVHIKDREGNDSLSITVLRFSFKPFMCQGQ